VIKAKHQERTERALAELKQRFEQLETEVITFFAVDSAEISEQAGKVARAEFTALEVPVSLAGTLRTQPEVALPSKRE
jgi:hypothetical protein